MSTYRVSSNASRQICRYFVNGYCNKGANCRYLHIQEDSGSHSSNSRGGTHYSNSNGESSSSTLNKSNSNSNHHRYKSTSEEVSICRYFLENRCVFGASCWFRHEKPVNGTNETNETNEMSSNGQKNDSKNQKDKQKAKEVVEEEFTCAICYEIPKTFGLLVQCDHIFCRNCIQEWRKTSNVSSPFQDVDTTKTCPVCRKNSPYIVPSARFAKSGPQKEQIISSYKEKVSRIPCKYFQDSGRCPFADACFYQHNNPDGSRCTLGPPLKRKKRYLSSFRFMTDSDIDFSISEIIGDLHFNFGWDYDENVGGWNDDDDDDDDDDEEISNFITEHRLTRMTNEEDDDNAHGWGSSDWSGNAHGWESWEDFDTDNVGGRIEVFNHDMDWL